jgi:oxygen-dependent protoporphyrinogen oxidase
MNQQNKKVILIGAGISGISAAYWIKQYGFDVHVLEKSHRVGGVIETIREGGYLFEKGPNSFLDNAPDTMDLCAQLNLENELLKQSLRGNKRFIYLNGKLHEVPTGPGGLVKTELLSGKSKRGLLAEPFRKANRSPEDESLADFIRRRLGNEILDHLVTPFVSGVYAGDPEKLSLRGTFSMLYELERQHGGLLRGGIARLFKRKKKTDEPQPKKKRAKNLCSYIDGMSVMTDALARELQGCIHLNAAIKEITYRPAEGFTVSWEDTSAQTQHGDALVLAVPAYAVPALASSLLPHSVEYLRSIPHNRLNVVGMSYAKDQIRHECDGFGFLSPRGQDIRILGSIWSSSLFPRRAPGGERSLTVFIGGGLDPTAYELPDEELMRQIQGDLQKSLGVSGEPRAVKIFRWEKAIPQYPIGHVEKIELLKQEQEKTPGLFLIGNYVNGVSTNDCIRNARQCAEQVRIHLDKAQ